MKFLGVFLKEGLNEEPSRMGNFILGVFSIILGLWLLLPPNSFAPTLHFGADKPPLWGSITEWQVGMAVLMLGLTECFFSIKGHWNCMRHVTIVATIWWSFVTFGYLTVLPEATSVPIFAFLATFSAYRYLLLSVNRRKNLRNNKKIGNI